MNSTQSLSYTVRAMCKYDLSMYPEALQVITMTTDQVSDEYRSRCERIVEIVDNIYENSDERTRKMMSLAFLRRDAISVEAAADIMDIGKTAAYSIVNKVLVKYAVAMGYVKKKQNNKEKRKEKEEWVS